MAFLLTFLSIYDIICNHLGGNEMEKLDRQKKIEKLESLKDDIKYYKKERRRIVAGNMGKGALLAIIPAIVGGLVGGSYISRKDLPGRRDMIENHAYNTITYSSVSGTKVTKEYKESVKKEELIDNLYHYGQWEEQGNGTYKCKVTEYELEDVTAEQIYELSRKEDLSFDDLLTLSIKSAKTTEYEKPNVTKEELENSSYFEIVVHDEDKKDVVKVLESEEENSNDIGRLVVCVLITLSGEAAVIAMTGGEIISFESTSYEDNQIKEYKKRCKEIKKEIKFSK